MNAWINVCTRPYVFVALCLIKHRDNFTFYVYMPACTCECDVISILYGGATATRAVRCPSQPRVRWRLGLYSRSEDGLSVKLTT